MYERLVEALRNMDVFDACPCSVGNMCDDQDCFVYQAADVIEKLEKAVPRWISVTERLPKESWERVLAYTDDGTVMTLPAIKLRNGYARYWMSLPEPPKEETS